MTGSKVLSDLSLVVVNDDPVQLRAATRILERAGASVEAFHGGAEAGEALAKGLSPHVIVLDLHMPGVDGWQLTRLLRSTDFSGFAGVPVLVVSSTFGGVDVEAVSKVVGANAFLALPAPPERLVRYVAQLARGETPRMDRLAVIFSEDGGLLQGLVECLEKRGAEVVIGGSRTSAEACRLADWVVWDADLPNERLAELLEELGGDSRRSALIVLSTAVDPMARLELLSAGADAVVPRAAHPALLMDAFDDLARQRSLIRVEDALKRRTHELSTAEGRYERLFHAIPDIVLLVDEFGVVTAGNDAARRSLGADHGATLAGLGLEDALSSTLVAPLAELPRSSAYDRTTGQGELRLASGEVRSVEATYQAIGDPAGHALIVLRDVTDRMESERRERDMEVKLFHGQKLESLGVMASGIAHDFNNLLLSILGNANLASDDIDETHPARPFIHQVSVAAERAAELTSQILAYSGQAERTVEPLQVGRLLVELVRLLDPALSKKASLSIEGEAEPLWITGDPSQVRQVLMNVIVNASDALNGAQGEIRVATRSQVVDGEDCDDWVGDPPSAGPYICIEVEDSGCGMTSDTLERIFDPFFTTKFTGRGLGLAATLGIIRAHGGGIKVRTSPESGTCFHVLFPAHLGPVQAANALEFSPSGLDRALPEGRILVVDDEPAVRDLVSRILERAGYDVVQAANGEEAIAAVERDPGGLAAVVLDTVMPVMDGTEALRRIKTLDPSMPVVMTSGNLTGNGPGALDQSADAYIQKPYRPMELRSVVTRVLGAVSQPSVPGGAS